MNFLARNLVLVALAVVGSPAFALSWGNPDVKGRPSTASFAEFRVGISGAIWHCPADPFRSEADSVAYLLGCFFNYDFYTGAPVSAHTYWYDHHYAGETGWVRASSSGAQPNSAVKRIRIGYTERIVHDDGRVETSAREIETQMTRWLDCIPCYAFRPRTDEFGPNDAPDVIPCNPEAGNARCEKDGNCGVGNPTLVSSGRKRQFETDIDLPGGLQFVRTYDSTSHPDWGRYARLGENWTHNYDKRLAIAEWPGFVSIQRFSPDRPHPESFLSTGNGFAGEADTQDRVAPVVDPTGARTGWEYVVGSDDSVERYDNAGRLLGITTRSGARYSLSYDVDHTLISVTDPVGRALTFAYDLDGRVSRVTDPAGNPFEYRYDAAGNLQSVMGPADPAGVRPVRIYHYEDPIHASLLTGITDENGWRFASYQYSGRMVRETRHNVSTTVFANRYSFAYSGAGDSTTVVDPLGTSRLYTFQSVLGGDRETGISQPCSTCGSSASALTYDANANVTSRTDFNGRKVCSAYDLARNLETARVEGLLSSEACDTALAAPPQRADVRRVVTTWHPVYRLPAAIAEPAPGGTRATTFGYDPLTGDLLAKLVVAPRNDGTSATLSRAWNWTYSTRGRVLTATDPNGRVTQYAYWPDDDADSGRRGNVRTITNPMGHVTEFVAYDTGGRPSAITDANGAVTTMSYDTRGRLIARSVAGEQTTYTYDPVGQLSVVTLPDGSTLRYLYDGAHRLTEVRDGLGNRIVYTLDGMGNRTSENVYDHAGVLTRTRSRAFNALNRLERELDAAGQATQYVYDTNGNRTRVIDPLNRQTVNDYDALNRRVGVIDPAGGQARYAYDASGLLLQVNDPRDVATAYRHDGLGNQVELRSPDSGIATMTFDPAGNLASRVDARGVRATYSYDALNRMTAVTFSKAGVPSEVHAFEYDGSPTGTANARGRLTRITDPAGEIRLAYTPRGRVSAKTQVAGTVALSVRYAYNEAGQLEAVTTPSGQTIDYRYLNNRVVSVKVNGQPLIDGAVAMPFGPMAAWQWGNSLYSFRRHDTDGRMASWEYAGATVLVRRNLHFDAASRITGLDDPLDPGTNAAYGYDALDRLTSAQRGNPLLPDRLYAYDPVGNRIASSSGGVTGSYTNATESNQLLAVQSSLDVTLLPGETRRVNGYNLSNRLVQVGDGINVLATYAVNALGQRVAKSANGTTTRFVYDEGGRLLGEYAETGNLIQETVWLDDLPIATLRPNGSAGFPVPTTAFYVLADHLGSPRTVIRPSDSAIVWKWDNVDPFGGNAADEMPGGNTRFPYNLRFPGQYFDSETGMHYNYFRDYDPNVGKYAQSDPIGLSGGLATYAYALDPLTQIDPTGEMGRAPGPGRPAPGPISRPGRPNAGCGPNGKLLELAIPDNPLYSFASCCDEHDGCYGDCTGKQTKEFCDQKFCDCLLKKCRLGRGGAVQGDCVWLASVYCSGVNGKGGQSAFDDSRKSCGGC